MDRIQIAPAREKVLKAASLIETAIWYGRVLDPVVEKMLYGARHELMAAARDLGEEVEVGKRKTGRSRDLMRKACVDLNRMGKCHNTCSGGGWCADVEERVWAKSPRKRGREDHGDR